jgi:hypothetical protein
MESAGIRVRPQYRVFAYGAHGGEKRLTFLGLAGAFVDGDGIELDPLKERINDTDRIFIREVRRDQDDSKFWTDHFSANVAKMIPTLVPEGSVTEYKWKKMFDSGDL